MTTGQPRAHSTGQKDRKTAGQEDSRTEGQQGSRQAGLLVLAAGALMHALPPSLRCEDNTWSPLIKGK